MWRELRIGTSSLCLVAGGLAAAFAALAPEPALRSLSLVAGALSLGLGLLVGLGPELSNRAQVPRRHLALRAGVAAVMTIPTALLLGPSGGFHHIVAFGPRPFPYMVLSGEGFSEGAPVVFGYGVRLNAGSLVGLLACWALVYLVVLHVAKRHSRRVRSAAP